MNEEIKLQIRRMNQRIKELDSIYHTAANQIGVSDGEITVCSFTKRTMRNLLVCVAAIVAEAVGASIGTYFYPGYGTLICDRLFANAPYIL